MNTIVYEPIGVIHSPFKETGGMPIQPAAAEGIKGTVEIFDTYAEGLKDIGGFSHIILIYHFHLSNGYSLEVKPFLDDRIRGVFSTRAPRRPNSIGLSVVKLNRLEHHTLYIENLDMVDGTPLLDIKPFIPDFDPTEEIKIGWLSELTHAIKNAKANDIFRHPL